MNARVVVVQVQPGKTDETIRIYRDSVVPAAKQQKGFEGGLLLTDSNTGKGISVTLWETEADMRAGETSGYYQEQIAKFAGVFAGPPVREAYEVSIRVINDRRHGERRKVDVPAQEEQRARRERRQDRMSAV